jgi:hypothetical protein
VCVFLVVFSLGVAFFGLFFVLFVWGLYMEAAVEIVEKL